MSSKLEIYDVLKVLSCKTKLKLIAHFYHCRCRKVCVNELVNKIGTTQANISKHLLWMKKQDIVDKQADSRNVYYALNKNFKIKFKDITEIILKDEKLKKYSCHCK